MGSIRTLLAIAVVFSHSYGFVFVGGQLAVQLFYIISGYLISYILVEAKTYTTIAAFYKNRFLRIFPVYWLVAASTLLLYGFSAILFQENTGVFKTFPLLDLFGRTSLVVTNLFLFGQDWIMFTAVRDGVFQLVTAFSDSEVAVWRGLLVPQAWSLGVELSFYLIAPFVLIRPKLMLYLLAASLFIRVYLIYIGLGFQDPWTYRFFPTELTFFLFGALSHQHWKPFLEKIEVFSTNHVNTVTLSVFVFCFIFFLLPQLYFNYFAFILIAFFILSLPLIFSFQSSNKWDRKVGELSYPIYISHMLVINKLPVITGVESGSLVRAFIIVVLTILVSFSINVTVGRMIEKMRSKVKESQEPP